MADVPRRGFDKLSLRDKTMNRQEVLDEVEMERKALEATDNHQPILSENGVEWVKF